LLRFRAIFSIRTNENRLFGRMNNPREGSMRRLLMGLLLPVLLFASGETMAGDYPDHAIKLVLPFPPGGETDPLARAIGQELGKVLGQPIVIENRPGAAGNIAFQSVASGPKDGYTLLMGFSNPLVVNPLLYKDLPFWLDHDLAPVSLLADSQFVLVVNPKLPVKSVQDLVDYAKANPGKLNFATTGVGSPLHLAAALFMSRTGTNMVHVPYQGGGAAALAVLTGEADVLFGSPSGSAGSIKAGKVTALGLTGTRRISFLPDLAPIGESALPGFTVTAWHSLMVPAGTPQPIIDKLHDAVIKALASQTVQDDAVRQGLVITGSTPQQVRDRVDAEAKMWRDVLKGAGIATVQ
jgi:tripartite-type tricarboxylate transporter receptor subunit TctC